MARVEPHLRGLASGLLFSIDIEEFRCPC